MGVMIMKRTSLFRSLALFVSIFGFTTASVASASVPTPNPLMLIWDGVVGCAKYVYTVGDNFIKTEVVPVIAKHPKITLGVTATAVGYLLFENYILKRNLRDLATYSCNPSAGISKDKAKAIAAAYQQTK